MSNNDVATILDEIGTMLELKGENPFKCRAYHNVARIIGALTSDLEKIVAEGQLTSIDGIGKGLAEKITELITTGKCKEYDELRATLPDGLMGMLRIQGLGPKRVKILYEKLNIKSVDELKQAAQTHRLEKLEGFGKKTEDNILLAIEQLNKHADKFLYSSAKQAADRLLATLKNQDGVLRCDVAGSLRRKKEVIGDIDILISAKRSAVQRLMETFTSHPDVESIIGKGETKSSVILSSGIHCDLRIVDNAEYPFALAYFTGSKEHNVSMRTLAKRFGWSLNEYGFSSLGSSETRGKAKQLVKCTTEEDIYSALGCSYVPPELREDMGELDAAASGEIPALVDDADLRGTFHCHTTYSDGSNTLKEMAAAAQALGWEYLGIADHSKIATYAGGLTEARVKKQHKEIDALNAANPKFRIFKGTEADILPNGDLDWNDKVLATFDYVVASIHSKFKMTEAEATKRIIKALKNKYVTMLGHPTGRLLLQRDGYPVNMIDVIHAAADYGKIIEINSHPLRLDLDWRLCKHAKEQGVLISINPDAHVTTGLRDVHYGIGIARKGWLEPRNILNTWSTKKVSDYFHSH